MSKINCHKDYNNIGMYNFLNEVVVWYKHDIVVVLNNEFMSLK